MRLRAFALIATLALGLLAATVPAEAQKPGKVYQVGLLSGLTRSVAERFWEPFLAELHDLGWGEGDNVIIAGRYAEGRMERFPNLATELVRLKVDVIVVGSTPGTRAAINATRTIPVVFTYVADPVGSGLVASLARPGGNATGIALMLARGIGGKQVELLKEVVPHASHFAVVSDPANLANHQNVGDMQRAAQALGVTLQSLEVRDPADFEPAFSAMTREGAEALLVLDGLIIKHRRQIVNLALTNRLPTMFWHPRFVRAGGLMSYGADHPAMMRRAAHLVDKILKGTKPADLPVERPTKFDLVINLKTAKALGLTIPPSLLFQADRVIR